MTDRTLATRRHNTIIALLGVLLVSFAAVTFWMLRSERSSTEARIAQANTVPAPEQPANAPNGPLPPSRREAIEEGIVPESTASSGAASVPEAATEEERGPTFVILVRDRSTRADLHGVELRCIPDVYYCSRNELPGGTDPYSILGTELRSPIAARFVRDRQDGANETRRFELGDGGEQPSRPCVLLNAAFLPRGVVFYARAPGYAWARLKVDPTSGGEREFLLERAADLSVRLLNVQTEAYGALDLPAILYVEKLLDAPTDDPNRSVSTVRLKDASPDQEHAFSAIEPGRYRVSVELGDEITSRERVILGHEEFELVAGGQRQLAVQLVDPPRPQRKATLSGTLSFPHFPGENEVVLRLFNTATYDQGPGDCELGIGAMDRLPGNPPQWRWVAPDLVPGRYQAKVWPFLVSTLIDLPPGGSEGAAITLEELAEVEVDVRSATTSEMLPIKEIFWTTGRPLKGMVNHLGDTIKAIDEGRFRLYTTPGVISFSVYHLPKGLAYGTSPLEQTVTAGANRIAYELQPLCAMHFVFRDGAATLPRGHEIVGNLWNGIRAVGGQGRITVDKLETESLVEVSHPGLYEVSFPNLDAQYEGVEPRRIEVRPGEIAEVVVDLKRK